MFDKNKSFELSEKFFEILESKLAKLNPSFYGYYNVFNNCREQGLQLIMYADNEVNEDLCIWSCMCRNSDQIMVVIANRNCSDNNNSFDSKAYQSAKYFNGSDYEDATDYAINVIKKCFSRYLDANYNYKFNCNRNIVDLEKIIDDAENLDYDDYYELATFEEGNYFCDLIILAGKVGLRYSRYLDNNHYDLENAHFEEFFPDLTNDVTLMLDMKQKLKNYVEELEYNINTNNGDMKICKLI